MEWLRPDVVKANLEPILLALHVKLQHFFLVGSFVFIKGKK
jgi:hypothetical protein